MISDDERTMLHRLLIQHLLRRVPSPADMAFELEPCAFLKPGEVSVIEGGFVLPSSMVSETREIVQGLGVKWASHLPMNYEGDVKFRTLQRDEAPLCKLVAPWFVDFYIDKSEAPAKVKELLRRLNEASQGGFIFRGEPELYREVRSSLSRYWNTRSPEASRAIGEKTFAYLHEYLRGQIPSGFETPAARESLKIEMLMGLRHRGGVANVVDFSSEVWVAVFFACQEKPRVPGRIWGLDPNLYYDDVKIHWPSDNLPHTRWGRQAAVGVLPETGVVPTKYLEEIIRIEPQQKGALLDFLKTIGLGIPYLFPDFEGYISNHQDYFPLEALVYMMREQLILGDYSKVRHFAHTRIVREDEQGRIAGYYFRGLANACEGRLKGAIQDLETCSAKIYPPPPAYLGENLEVVRGALQGNGNRNYQGKKGQGPLNELKKKICMDVDEKLWSVSLSGFTFRKR